VTGIGWVDWLAVVAFAAVTLLSLARPYRDGDHVQHVHHDAFHAVMGVAMVTMFWPGGGMLPGRVWVAVVGLIIVWPVLVFASATRARQPQLRPARRRPWSGRAGYYLASTLVMLVAFGAGHDGAGLAHPSLPRRSGMPGMGQPSAGHDLLSTAAGWPIWPLIGAAFILYGGWLAFAGRRRHPPPDLACTMVMAAGMAFMAFSI
jgi:hypothetical protein